MGELPSPPQQTKQNKVRSSEQVIPELKVPYAGPLYRHSVWWRISSFYLPISAILATYRARFAHCCSFHGAKNDHTQIVVAAPYRLPI